MNPFADDTASTEIGGLSIENSSYRVSIHGSVDLDRDKAGLKKAKALRQHIEVVVAALEDDKELPEKSTEPKHRQVIQQPFSIWAYEVFRP